jgi:hypothetical protein
MQPHKLDYVALGITILGAFAELTDYLPPKYAGLIMMAVAMTRVYVRLAGQTQSLTDGQNLGKEIKTDIEVMEAKKPIK